MNLSTFADRNDREQRLISYANRLITKARFFAIEARTCPIFDFNKNETALIQLESTISLFLSFIGPCDNSVQSDNWARAASRGHDLTNGRFIYGNLEQNDAILRSCGVDPLRRIWAPGLTYDEAIAVCSKIGRMAPPQLLDIDERREYYDEYWTPGKE